MSDSVTRVTGVMEGSDSVTTVTPLWKQRIGDGTARPLTPPCGHRRLRLLCPEGRKSKKSKALDPTQPIRRSLTAGRHDTVSRRMTLLKEKLVGACRAEGEVAPPGGVVRGRGANAPDKPRQ
jgi:hypothetical protein